MTKPTAAYRAARADLIAQRTLPRIVGTPSTDLRARAITEVKPVAGPIRNRRAPRMTAVQRNSIGRRSEWNRSPFAPKGGWR